MPVSRWRNQENGKDLKCVDRAKDPNRCAEEKADSGGVEENSKRRK